MTFFLVFRISEERRMGSFRLSVEILQSNNTDSFDNAMKSPESKRIESF
jgi:hypothetical protein